MTDTPAYTPPEVWVWEKDNSPKWRYSNTNRPIAGVTHEKELPRGKHPLRTFLQTHQYKNLTRWTKEIGERPAVKRGRMVNRTSGPPEEQLHERHDASDFETKTQDKNGARA